MTQFFSLGALSEKLSHFDLKSLVEFQFHQWLNFLSQKDWIFFSRCTERKIESFWPKILSYLSWDKNIQIEKKKKYCIGYPTGNGKSSIIAKAVNKQNTSKLLLYKLYFKMTLKMILKSFEFQCDFDFQITTSKMIWILILNHFYLGDLILILKSSTYDDFAHLCQ